MVPRIRTLRALLGAAIAGLGCDSGSTGPVYNPVIPTSWAGAVTNPFFPLAPGTIYEYQGQTAQGVETDSVEVLANPRVVNGVSAVEVHDRVFLDGSLIEETFDWYAQDSDGNVWYLGEDSREIQNGQVVSTEGSWEWGVGNALPGIIMWADPAAQVGMAYRQEYSRGVAQDWGKVLAVNESVDVPYGSFTGCIRTDDWSGLEPAVVETKYYCPQVGSMLEVTTGERIELLTVSAP
jgi:hypothetical protein